MQYRHPVFLRLVLLLCAQSLTACDTLGYYFQALDGHAQLMHRSRDMGAVQRDPGTSQDLRQRLELALRIRDFAIRELGLPDNGSYASYTELERDAVVWSLVTTPEFSLQPIQWCYPVIGCAAYRGYFAESDADAAARELARQGRDWTLEPVAAYSTLGWFADPLPSTVLHWPEARLAGLVFHELAHQRLYLPDDSSFNESFANAVETAGVQRWLQHRGDAAALQAWYLERQRHQAFVDLLRNTRARLQILYANPLAEKDLRRLKQLELQRLRDEYRQLSDTWRNGVGYDTWFERPLNNARLALVDTYEHWQPAFLHLLCQYGGEFKAFHQAAEALAELGPVDRRLRLESLATAAQLRTDWRSCP